MRPRLSPRTIAGALGVSLACAAACGPPRRAASDPAAPVVQIECAEGMKSAEGGCVPSGVSQPGSGATSPAAGAAVPQDELDRPCAKQPRPGDVQGAKAAFRKGNASFQGGDYAEALRLFREAYRLDCTAHLMLMNMARTQELLGERRGAARTLRAYMKRRPNDPDAETIRRRIENLER